MKYLFLSLVVLITNLCLYNISSAEEYNNSEFSIQIPETWQAVELDKDGFSR